MEKKAPFSEKEYLTLKNYENPGIVRNEDKGILEKFSLVGWVKWGLDIKKGNETALLTEEAKDVIELFEETGIVDYHKKQ